MAWKQFFTVESSPRPWGCFPAGIAQRHQELVFPTPVGVFLYPEHRYNQRHRLPHARGGVSRMIIQNLILSWSSPRPWGCFPLLVEWCCCRLVFPTPVGVFLSRAADVAAGKRLPHARGGVSIYWWGWEEKERSSPRPWGCFSLGNAFLNPYGVFPTPVGVFLNLGLCIDLGQGLPHARGGVSIMEKQTLTLDQSSPRPWGCFYRFPHGAGTFPVFPTPVGVFLRKTPHDGGA